jgi:hypothetical protein
MTIHARFLNPSCKWRLRCLQYSAFYAPDFIDQPADSLFAATSSPDPILTSTAPLLINLELQKIDGIWQVQP